MSDIQLGGDAAVMGGVHSDSHNVETHTTNNNTTHNSTVTDNSKTINNHVVQEAQLTDAQLNQQNEVQFLIPYTRTIGSIYTRCKCSGLLLLAVGLTSSRELCGGFYQ